MMRLLGATGFVAQPPAGAYHVMADISRLAYEADVTAARSLVEATGVATAPGSSFFSDPANASAGSSKSRCYDPGSAIGWSHSDGLLRDGVPWTREVRALRDRVRPLSGSTSFLAGSPLS